MRFFNREWREHDYLWGRLNAAERLVRVLRDVYQECYEAERPVLPEKDRKLRDIFFDILEEEETHLEDHELVRGCREAVYKVFSKRS